MICIISIIVVLIILIIWSIYEPSLDIVTADKGIYKLLLWYNKWESGGKYFRRSFFELLRLNFKK
jgi:hypothetical protein